MTLTLSLKYSKHIVCVDDSTVYIDGKNLMSLFDLVSNDLLLLSDYFKAHNLKLNARKNHEQQCKFAESIKNRWQFNKQGISY